MRHRNIAGIAVVAAALLPLGLAGCRDGNAEGGAHKVPHLTSAEEFDQKVRQAEGPVLVDFYRDNCGPCERLAPRIAKLHEEYQGKAAVYKVHNRKGREIVSQFGIRGFPTVILFHDGQSVRRWDGFPTKPAEQDATVASYRAAIDSLLRTQPQTQGADS